MKLKTLLKTIPQWEKLIINANEKNFLPTHFQGKKNELGFMLGEDKMLNANVECCAIGKDKDGNAFFVIEVRY